MRFFPPFFQNSCDPLSAHARTTRTAPDSQPMIIAESERFVQFAGAPARFRLAFIALACPIARARYNRPMTTTAPTTASSGARFARAAFIVMVLFVASRVLGL